MAYFTAICGRGSVKPLVALWRRWRAQPEGFVIGEPAVLCSRSVRLPTLALIVSLLASAAPVSAALWPSAVQRVERDLHSQDVDVRRRAALELRDLPKGSGARLASAALDDADLNVRLTALDACLGFGLPALGEKLIPWLSDGERRLRLAAAVALGESPNARAVPSLGRALGDGDAAVRGAAAAGPFGRRGARGPPRGRARARRSRGFTRRRASDREDSRRASGGARGRGASARAAGRQAFERGARACTARQRRRRASGCARCAGADWRSEHAHQHQRIADERQRRSRAGRARCAFATPHAGS